MSPNRTFAAKGCVSFHPDLAHKKSHSVEARRVAENVENIYEDISTTPRGSAQLMLFWAAFVNASYVFESHFLQHTL